MNDDDATFCYTCGRSFHAPPPVNAPVQAQQYAAPPAPAKKKSKTLLIVLIVVGIIAIATIAALLLLLPRPGVDTADVPGSGTQEAIENVGAEVEKEAEEVKEEDAGEEEEKEAEEEKVEDAGEEEEEADNYPDEPPFIKTLRTGVYGYEYRTQAKSGADAETITFVYSDGFRVVVGAFWPNGEVPLRDIAYYEKDELYAITDTIKSYTVLPYEAQHYFYTKALPDHLSGMDQTGNGTADCNGETLDYIDYISGKTPIRFFLKDGDVYAFRHPESDSFTFFLTNTYSAPPTMEYFEITDEYTKFEFQMPTP